MTDRERTKNEQKTNRDRTVNERLKVGQKQAKTGSVEGIRDS
jgi:hypothetical protein